MCIDADDNELETLEIIHHYVEILDRYFGNVSRCCAPRNPFSIRPVKANTVVAFFGFLCALPISGNVFSQLISLFLLAVGLRTGSYF